MISAACPPHGPQCCVGGLKTLFLALQSVPKYRLDGPSQAGGEEFGGEVSKLAIVLEISTQEAVEERARVSVVERVRAE